MAKVSAVERNKKRIRLAKKYEAKRARLKEIIYDKNTPVEERFKASLMLAELPRNSAKNRLRNRCNLTGRPRSYHRRFGISRIALRDLAQGGELPGVTKSSW